MVFLSERWGIKKIEAPIKRCFSICTLQPQISSHMVDRIEALLTVPTERGADLALFKLDQNIRIFFIARIFRKH